VFVQDKTKVNDGSEWKAEKLVEANTGGCNFEPFNHQYILLKSQFKIDLSIG